MYLNLGLINYCSESQGLEQEFDSENLGKS